MNNLEEQIEQIVGEVRLDSLDLSFGEIMSLYQNKEFVISPDFQRYFRWSLEQRSRLIESIVLELPIPQIFVVENQDGTLELIDGLQRISSVVHFVQPDLLGLDTLHLDGCDLIPALNGSAFDDLPLALRLRIKRSSVRAVVIKRQSTSLLRYAMFKRLNTGGSELEEQEIRNCTARMVGAKGVAFYDFLRTCADDEAFQVCTSTLSDSSREKRGDEELVLRFFALKEGFELFKGSVRDWLDRFMEDVIFEKRPFDIANQTADFSRLFAFLKEAVGEGAFVRYRGGSAIGGLAPAYFEAVSLGVWQVLDSLENIPADTVRNKLVATLEHETFRANVGSGSNSLQKFNGRIDFIRESLQELKA